MCNMKEIQKKKKAFLLPENKFYKEKLLSFSLGQKKANQWANTGGKVASTRKTTCSHFSKRNIACIFMSFKAVKDS